jgi:hypothetical protein
MAAALKAIAANVSADGVVTLSEPVHGPCKAIVTLLIEDCTPNAETLAAMDEAVEDLPRYSNTAEAKATLRL